MIVAYELASGAFSESAVARLFPEAKPVAHRTFTDVFAALSSGTVAAAVVPVENSHAGSVVDVYDLLRTHADVSVIGETVVPVRAEAAPDNFTRFFAVARAGDEAAAARLHPAVAGGLTKTSLVYATKNVPGALIHSLQPFAVARIQLTKIESRPSRATPWEYIFYLDFEGDPASEHVADALEVVRASCSWVRILGTYRAATDGLEQSAA